MACSASFLVPLRTNIPGWLNSELVPPTSIFNQGRVLQICLLANAMEAISPLRVPPHRHAYVCVRLIKVSQHSTCVICLLSVDTENIFYRLFFQANLNLSTLGTCTAMRRLGGSCSFSWPSTCVTSTRRGTKPSSIWSTVPEFISCPPWTPMALRRPHPRWEPGRVNVTCRLHPSDILVRMYLSIHSFVWSLSITESQRDSPICC